MANLLEDIKRDLGPYWKHEGLDVNLNVKALVHVLSRAEGGTPHKVDEAMREANKLLKMHGVEAIRDENYGRRGWGEVRALYVNTGDAYGATVFYDVETKEFSITSWGDWLETYEREHGGSLP